MKSTALALVLFCCNALAQTPLVPPNVTSVITLGYWQHAGQAGTYRVITTTEGWEHVWSRVFVEWLPEPTQSNPSAQPFRVVEVLPPFASGTAVLQATVQRQGVGAIIISVGATPNYEQHAKSKQYRFKATSPGVVEALPEVKQ